VVQREGPRGLSLRGVARELGVDPSTLYAYVDGKAGLVVALAEQAAEEAVLPEPGASGTESWEDACMEVCRAVRNALDAHPELALLDGEWLPLSSFNARATAALAAALVGSGLDAARCIDAAQILLYQVTALSRVERGLAAHWDHPEDIRRYHELVGERLHDAELGEAWDGLMTSAPGANFDRLFELGIASILLGLVAGRS
jgi:AcrR family transcriptional regulator